MKEKEHRKSLSYEKRDLLNVLGLMLNGIVDISSTYSLRFEISAHVARRNAYYILSLKISCLKVTVTGNPWKKMT